MVSVLSQRLLGVSGDSNSISSKGSSSQRRQSSTYLPTRQGSSNSGYSADRESPSATPPVLSIDFQGSNKRRHDNDPDCPKRQKKIEMQYTASTIDTDLKRAGKEIQRIDKEMKETSRIKGATIKLNGVKLLISGESEGPCVESNISATASLLDYEMLVKACLNSYPSSFTSFPNTQESSCGSTSSMSDTESDSISSTFRNQSLLIPPLLDDSFDAPKQASTTANIKLKSCNVISCPSNAVTMTEMLQLSEDARLVTLSAPPFTVVYANGPMFRLMGSGSTGRNIVGESFSKTLGSDDKTILSDCMVSSSTGNHKLMHFKKDKSGNKVEYRVKVSPIVAQRFANREVAAVTHFAVEFIGQVEPTLVGEKLFRINPYPAVGVVG